MGLWTSGASCGSGPPLSALRRTGALFWASRAAPGNWSEGRNTSEGYKDVGFRIIQVLNGEEPEQKVELTTLPAPMVSAALSDDSIQLSWQPVEDAVEYQIFEYDQETGLVRMLEHTSATSSIVTGLASGHHLQP